MLLKFKFDACIGGARRDEEKRELKNVFFCSWWFWSVGWKNQRPELFDLLNGKIENGQNVRVLFQTGQN
jgi:sulfate adenylyltransferase subunit 2